jgi:hypothetical protein
VGASLLVRFPGPKVVGFPITPLRSIWISQTATWPFCAACSALVNPAAAQHGPFTTDL